MTHAHTPTIPLGQLTLPHSHRWKLETPNGAMSQGVCACGAVRQFGNSEEAVDALHGTLTRAWNNKRTAACIDCGAALLTHTAKRCRACNGRHAIEGANRRRSG